MMLTRLLEASLGRFPYILARSRHLRTVGSLEAYQAVGSALGL